MSYQNVDEENNLSIDKSDNHVPLSFNYTKVVMAGTVSLLMVVGLAFTPIGKISDSFSDLNVFGESIHKKTANHSDGDIVELEHHDIDCGFLPLKGFVGGTSYTFECLKTDAKFITEIEFSTPPSSHGGLTYLDRQKVYCPNDSLMSRFHLVNKGWWSIEYGYDCVKYDVKSYTCSDRYTETDGHVDGIVNLKHHPVECEDGEALKGWEGVSPCLEERNEHGRCHHPGFKIKYTCCSAEALEPTNAPIAEPTLFPNAHPTHAPVHKPTHEPSELPVSHPTNHPVFEPSHVPISLPTLHPVVSPTMSPNRDIELKLEIEGAKYEKNQIELILNKEKENQRMIAEVQKELDNAQKGAHAAERQMDKENAIKYAEQAEEAAQKLQKILQGVDGDKEKLEYHQGNLQALEIIHKRSGDSKVCPFTFKSGITKIVVPEGCAFFGQTDSNFEAQKEMETQAIYVCVDIYSPLELDYRDFKKYGLADKGKSLISTAIPGGEVTIDIFSQDELLGLTKSLTPFNYKPLFQEKYDGSDVMANDNVYSVRISSKKSQPLLDCKRLVFSDLMVLNVNLMEPETENLDAPVNTVAAVKSNVKIVAPAKVVEKPASSKFH